MSETITIYCEDCDEYINAEGDEWWIAVEYAEERGWFVKDEVVTLCPDCLSDAEERDDRRLKGYL